MEIEYVDGRITKKDWFIFIAFVVVLLFAGFLIGASIGRNHPSSKAMEKELTEIRVEVDNIESTYREIINNQDLAIEWRDSLINAMRKELTKGEPYNLPIVIKIEE